MSGDRAQLHLQIIFLQSPCSAFHPQTSHRLVEMARREEESTHWWGLVIMLDLVTASVQSTKDREKFKDDFSSLGSLKRDDPADGTDFTICSVICVTSTRQTVFPPLKLVPISGP